VRFLLDQNGLFTLAIMFLGEELYETGLLAAVIQEACRGSRPTAIG
jgi:hypothetical protein